MATITKEAVQTWAATNHDRIQADYFELLKFPSIGADQNHLGDCANCATWIKKQLRALGFDVTLKQDTLASPPIVFAERLVEDSSHTILFYGHYDVQPVDPLNLWESDPFTPTRRGDRVYARGAQDDKGQWFAFLQGLRAVQELGGELPSMRILLEGQEESGSTALANIAAELRQDIAADILLVADTGMDDDSGRPSIVAGLRGVVHFTLTLKGAGYDLHSGLHGGLAPNPAQGMAELIASLHTATGGIAVEGFLDRVVPPNDQELALSNEVPFDEANYTASVGVAPCGGEKGLSPRIRNAFMPTIEINGIHTGYGGPGSKTVIPCEALAKLSCRLVPDQSPAEIVDCLQAHIQAHCPEGMVAEISEITGCEPGFRLPISSPVMQLARDVLTGIDPRGAVIAWEGASIPIVARLRDVTGAAPLMVGWGLQADRIHSPNESFSDEQFAKGVLWGALILSALA